MKRYLSKVSLSCNDNMTGKSVALAGFDLSSIGCNTISRPFLEREFENTFSFD